MLPFDGEIKLYIKPAQ